MFFVLFEVVLKKEEYSTYLEIAKELNEYLKKFDGFISVERFASISDKNKILSISIWRNLDSIEKWKKLEKHQEAQILGRNKLFLSYKISIEKILTQYENDSKS